MSLVSMGALLANARSRGYCIPAFNFDTFDTLFGVIAAAEETASPLILQITQPALEFLGLDNVVDVVRNESERSGLPIALHLDHCEDIAQLRRCIQAGFTSVMIDASRASFEENVRITSEVLAMARPVGVSVEAEIGHVGTVPGPGGGETESGRCADGPHDGTEWTDELIAASFWQATRVDALAVSVGSVHGMTERHDALDFFLLERVAQCVPAPLVLHGASGISDEDVRRAARIGVAKTNVETELRAVFRRALETEFAKDAKNIKLRALLKTARAAVQEAAARRQQVAGCAGHALDEL